MSFTMYTSSYTGSCLQRVWLQWASQCTLQVTLGPDYNEFGYNELHNVHFKLHWVLLTTSLATMSFTMYTSSYTGSCLQRVWLQWAFGFNEQCLLSFSRRQRKLRKGNVFTSMCQEFCPRWMEVYNPPGRHLLWVDIPGQTPLLWADPQWTNSPHGQTPPTQQTATVADTTDPTGMHSFCGIKLIKWNWFYYKGPFRPVTD